jgi:hypothetical protein|tara:strand:+ start:212 stop:565 length:354 start_codon:yes stop_codon:yes gene_type:complete
MASNIKTATVDAGGTGSGILVDITTSVTLNSTNTMNDFIRIYAIHSNGDTDGVCLITGEKQIIAKGGASGSAGVAVKWTDEAGSPTDIYLGDIGPRVRGVVKVSAAASATAITVFYG